MMRSLGLNTVELCFVKLSEFNDGQIDSLEEKDLFGFSYVSLHAPNFPYNDDQETRDIFRIIARLNKIRALDLVVFHPDTVLNFSVFSGLPFPISFENMDDRKNSYKNKEELESLFRAVPQAGLVLDINHVYANDPSLGLAEDIIEMMREKIVEIHMSGYETGHDSIYKTQQFDFIKQIASLDRPIIIESLLTPETVLSEVSYIQEGLKKCRP